MATMRRPLASKRPRIVPTRPRSTASGLSRTRVRSDMAVDATDVAPPSGRDPYPGGLCPGIGTPPGPERGVLPVPAAGDPLEGRGHERRGRVGVRPPRVDHARRPAREPAHGVPFGLV